MINKIAIAGDYRCGKDYLGAKLVNDFGFTRLAFADVVKEEAAIHHPDLFAEIFAAEKTPEIRKILCRIGNELNKNKCFTTYRVASQASRLSKVVITDLRFASELKYCLKNHYKIVFLGQVVDNYNLLAIYGRSHLKLQARPNITAAELIDMLE